MSLLLGYLGYRALQNNKQPSIKALTLIPDGCSALFTYDNYTEFANSLRNKNLLWQDLRSLSSFSSFEKHLAYFDSLLILHPDLTDLVQNNPVYLSIYPDKTFLITLNFKELCDETKFTNKLSTIFPPNGAVRLFVQVKDGVLAVSDTESLLSKLFDDKFPKLIDNANFITLNNEVNYGGSSVYVNHYGLLNKSFSSINIKPESIALNGIKNTDSLLFTGDKQAAALTGTELLNHIPLLCNAFEIYAVQNGFSLSKKHENNNWWLSVNEQALFNAEKQFHENIKDFVITTSLPSKNKALVVSISDSLKIAELIPYISDSSFTHKQIIKLQKKSFSFSKSTFPVLSLSEMNYMLMFSDHLVFTSTEQEAEIFLNASINKSSLLDNLSFRSYAVKNFDTDFHYLRYFSVNSLSKEQLPFDNSLIESDLNYLKNISHCSFLSTYKSDFLNFRFYIKFLQESISDDPNLLWTLNADTTIITKPWLFKNHMTQGAEIVFQTGDKILQLQNATGKIIWKKQIAESVRSDIFMVDAFKNGKLQLLFNTDNYIHLIDRNGKYVQGYPVKLSSKATNKLSVLDYENKKDWRLFIACADNKIYNYSIWGIKNEGFKPYLTADQVVLPIKYCKVGLSDYLITADHKGRLYAFSRKGDGRIDFKNKMTQDVIDFELVSGNSLATTQIIYFDEKNYLLNKISLGDKKEIFKTSEAQVRPAYCFNDADKNSITDLIIAGKELIEVYDINGNKNFQQKLKENFNPHVVNFYSVNNSSIINALDKENTTLVVANIDQQKIKEYKSTQIPLICDVFNDGKTYLILVSGKQIRCYKL